MCNEAGVALSVSGKWWWARQSQGLCQDPGDAHGQQLSPHSGRPAQGSQGAAPSKAGPEPPGVALPAPRQPSACPRGQGLVLLFSDAGLSASEGQQKHPEGHSCLESGRWQVGGGPAAPQGDHSSMAQGQHPSQLSFPQLVYNPLLTSVPIWQPGSLPSDSSQPPSAPSVCDPSLVGDPLCAQHCTPCARKPSFWGPQCWP